ncbi:rCG37486 [Rattus norvegicus]|uniref:RCG37486 n=1 Tax=Rattus norvegicus TaxID=10116 RepID=A6KHK9_RAT|nr:rCG37486 [Rattus norvegicus]
MTHHSHATCQAFPRLLWSGSLSALQRGRSGAGSIQELSFNRAVDTNS